jgi:probable FeS assembly SUF system protein SufT
MSESIALRRDCEAIVIPYGNSTTLREGVALSVVQQLGDTFTVRTEDGHLLRIAGHDADALGLVAPQPTHAAAAADPNAPVDEARVWDVLRTCYDPEIPSDIVELGLIYTVQVSPHTEGGTQVAIEMTLTAPGCGMGQVLKDDVERKVAEMPGVTDVTVELVFDPPWEPALMSEAARLHLGML